MLVREETIPLARRYGHVVVAFGPSTHDEDSYYLIRSFTTDEERRRAVDGLHGSEEWLRDYDQRVMSFIESYQTAVFATSAEAVRQLIEASRESE